MKRTIGILLVLAVLVLPAWAEGEEAKTERSPEAIEILEKVDAAIKKIDSVAYKAKTEATGDLAAGMGEASGSVVMKGWNGGMPNHFRVHVTAKQPDSEEPVEMTAGGNGDSYFLLDHAGKKGYEDMDPGVLGSAGGQLIGFAMIEFVHDRPFDDELAGETVTLLEEMEIAGEPCYAVDVFYSGGRGHATWYFSKNDYLPRRRVQHISGERGEGTIVRTVMDLKIAPETDASLFTMKLPEGFEQIDDFAP